MAGDLFVGVMSGTSLDGIDAALVDFAQLPPRVIGTHYRPYPDPIRAEASALNSTTDHELDRSRRLARALSDLYAEAVLALLDSSAAPAGSITAIGCHGQTVRHRPELGYTVQLVDGARLAERTGIDVVTDFRSRDIAAGGQGAPLVPAFHRMWFGSTAADRAVVNIGGIANISVLTRTGRVTGWDTGPGNVLLDAWAERHTGRRYDDHGEWAATGQVIEPLLGAMLADPYFALAPPKSTGRDAFHPTWLAGFRPAQWHPVDVQATLVALTAASISASVQGHVPEADAVYVCGGGAQNETLMDALRTRLPGRSIESTRALGLDPDWVEAAAFAWLARCTVRREAANEPLVTGAAGLRVLGAIYPA